MSENTANFQAIPCPVCGSNEMQPYKWGLVQCISCTLVLSPSIWMPQVNEQMEEEWFGENYLSKSSLWVTIFEFWNNRRTMARLSRAKPTGRRLLEIGVGSGSFLSMARDEGFDVMGCDLSPQICDHVSRAHIVTMHCGPLDTLEESGTFDVIVANHVLEHVTQPVEFLQNIHRLLSQVGMLHVAVPNLGCREAQLPGWTSYEPYHLSYFNPRTLEGTIESSGIVVDRIQTHESFSGWFLAVLRTVMNVNGASIVVRRPAENMRKQAIEGRPRLVEHLYRFALVLSGVVSWPVRWIQAMLGYGDEAVCIAYKSMAATTR